MKRIDINERTKTFNELRLANQNRSFKRGELVQLLRSHGFGITIITYLIKNNVFEKLSVENQEKRYFFKKHPLLKDRLVKIYGEINQIAKNCRDRRKTTDSRPVIERIKTFEDACSALGFKHPLVLEYKDMAVRIMIQKLSVSTDIIAYLRLRIIVAALNEDWIPRFEKGEKRYYPWFYLHTKAEYNKLDKDEKGRCVLRSGHGTNAFCGFVFVNAFNAASFSFSYNGSRLAFKTRELAEYAAKQFLDEWANFMF